MKVLLISFISVSIIAVNELFSSCKQGIENAMSKIPTWNSFAFSDNQGTNPPPPQISKQLFPYLKFTPGRLNSRRPVVPSWSARRHIRNQYSRSNKPQNAHVQWHRYKSRVHVEKQQLNLITTHPPTLPELFDPVEATLPDLAHFPSPSTCHRPVPPLTTLYPGGQ